MIALAPGASSSLTSPTQLVVYCVARATAGLFLADPVALSFAIDDLHDPTVAAAQIYPAPSGAVTAAVESVAGPFALVDGQTLLVRFEDGVTQTIILTAGAFAAIGGDITSAPAWQVAAVVNEALGPGKSFPSSGATAVTLASDVPGAGGSVEVLGGTAAPALGFPAGKVTGSGGTAGRQPVDLVIDRLGLGRFVATWTAPSNAPVGRYRIRWYLTQAAGDAERAWSEAFEILAQPSSGEAYALVADVRAEGVTAAQATDRRISDALRDASRLIEAWTGHFFGPRYKTIQVDGARTSTLPLDEPICAIEGLRYLEDTTGFVDPGGYEIYGRHLSQGLLSPDDRQSPKIVYRGWGRGDGELRGYGGYGGYDMLATYGSVGRYGRTLSHAQSTVIVGVFGYTDPDPTGAPLGITPTNITRATILLALRNVPKAAGANTSAVFDAQNGHRIRSQKTREQSIEWSDAAALRGPTLWTGDPAIDGLLLTYCKPLSVSAV